MFYITSTQNHHTQPASLFDFKMTSNAFKTQPGFKEAYRTLRLAEAEEEIKAVVPERFYKQPPHTHPVILEYRSQREASSYQIESDIELSDNDIHRFLRAFNKDVQYYYKATKPPYKATIDEGAPARYISILVDFPMEVTQPTLSTLVSTFPDISGSLTGSWSYKTPAPSEDTALWRVQWFRKELVTFNWGFWLVGYNHGSVEVDEDNKLVAEDSGAASFTVEEKAEALAELEAEDDGGYLGPGYGLCYIPDSAWYGP
ncbi:uncharacterized protein DSM5745_10386 [Aspergillus mulundensis]|uniref:Uncharacterized protein n=1 Tax=Aspergillus mulundensis TaxID=1810919 RepID=A0A3D8QJV5_9EURO|nr:hypothetical protein DSM5745_10386 [Aspergillus mulundensis]RDW61714.1 hypothetical protein DSM5745_10386 [Aspergillus mulundensis]